MVDPGRVTDLITNGEALLADVRRYRDDVGRDRFLTDRGEQYRIFFPLQQAIQVGIDLAAHLLAGQPGHQPTTLAATFQSLADRDLIDQELATQLAAMARFRNLLVHQYADIDPAQVWQIINTRLDDLERFLREVTAILSRELRDDS